MANDTEMMPDFSNDTLRGDISSLILDIERLANSRLGVGDLQSAANAYTNLGQYLDAYNKPREAISAYQKALELLSSLNDEQQKDKIFVHIGNIYMGLTEYAESIASFDKALASARLGGDRETEGNALGDRGLALLRSRKMDEARGHFERQLFLARSCENNFQIAHAFLNFGTVEYECNSFGRAIGYFEDCLRSARPEKAWTILTVCLVSLANCWKALGHFQEAIQ